MNLTKTARALAGVIDLVCLSDFCHIGLAFHNFYPFFHFMELDTSYTVVAATTSSGISKLQMTGFLY